MDWKRLEHLSQIEDLKKESLQRPVLIFKHSTRCSISFMVWNRLKSNWKPQDTEKISPYYLDLISYRDISNAIEKEFDVYHESPQVIILKDGAATYDNSHSAINYQDILAQIEG